MTAKIVEIRDSGTFIPALAVRLGSPNERERKLLARIGYGRTLEDQAEYIVLCKINGGEPCLAHIDPFAWGQNPRTMFIAHMYLLNRQGELRPRNDEPLPRGMEGNNLVDSPAVVQLRPWKTDGNGCTDSVAATKSPWRFSGASPWTE